MKLSIIVAVADDMAIGRRGDQPFYIKDDLRHFKKLTTGHPVIMGRKTFEALPRGPLPNRLNIIVSRKPDLAINGAVTATSLDRAIALAGDADEAFIIGGGELYREALTVADSLYVTHIEATVPDADTFFPTIDPSLWRLDDESAPATDETTGLAFTYRHYTRIAPKTDR